jgi:hypothetical protein
LSHAGALKIPEGEKTPYDECLKLHFNFCLQIYVAYPPPGVQTYGLEDIEDLEEEAGVYERDAGLPDLTDPIWNSPIGREVLRAAMAWRCVYSLYSWWDTCSRLIQPLKYPVSVWMKSIIRQMLRDLLLGLVFSSRPKSVKLKHALDTILRIFDFLSANVQQRVVTSDIYL